MREYFQQERLNLVKRSVVVAASSSYIDQTYDFEKVPIIAYLRCRSLQDKLLNSMLKHIEFTAFQILGLSMSIYQQRLFKEMQVLQFKRKCQLSPHQVIRVQSTLVISPFIKAYEEIHFKFDKFRTKNISFEEVKAYCNKFNKLKREAFKISFCSLNEDQLCSAFDFLDYD